MAVIPGKKSDTRAKRQAHARQVRIGAPDPRLTPAAGVEAVREVDRVLWASRRRWMPGLGR